MRHAITLAFGCILILSAGSLNAQTTYTTTGGNALMPEVLSTVELPDGNMLVRTLAHGFSWSNEEAAVGGNGALECYGSSTMSPEGAQLDGSGTCEAIDPDGDIWWLWWDGGMDGRFGFTGGTGKYAGIEGSGTWKLQTMFADGKNTNTWEGTWTLPAQGEEGM